LPADQPAGRRSGRSRSSADFCAGFTLFRRDRVSLSEPPLEHCGDTVLAESFARDAPNMKSAAEINPLVRAREVFRGFIPHRAARAHVLALADTLDNSEADRSRENEVGRVSKFAVNENLIPDL